MIIAPALINPLRWINTADLNKSFDGNFALNQLEWYQSKRCYFQPWQTGDRLKQQIIADVVPPNIDIVSCETNQIAVSIPFALVPAITLPETPTFFVYELDYSFAGLPIGKYYASFDTYTSQPFDIQVEHINTTLIKYKHSDNDFDVVFDTGIEFQLRAECLVDYQSPKANRDVYFDQPHNSTQLSSVTFRNFKLYLGFQWGLPQWMLDKIAHVLGVDQVSYDDVAYQVAPDAEFEVEKNTDNNFMGGSIDVQPVDNNFIRYITSGVVPPPSFKPMQKVVKLTSISGNQTVNNVFRADSFLRQVTVYKTGIDYTLLVGTTPGGNDIGEFEIDVNTGANFEVTWLFDGTTNVYLSGTGLNADRLYLVYDQLDEPDIPLTPSDPVDSLGKGAKMMWEGTDAEFNDTWDDATGLGKANTKYTKWCIAGTNGTTIVDGKVHIGINVTTTPDYTTLGDDFGSDTKVLTKSNLPAEPLGIGVKTSQYGQWNRSSGSARPIVGVGGINADLGTDYTGNTENMGSATPFNVQQLSVISLFIVKLVD